MAGTTIETSVAGTEETTIADGGTTAADASTDAGGTTVDGTAGEQDCACIIDDDPDATFFPSLPSCGELQCGEFTLDCGGATDCAAPEAEVSVSDPAALDCALVALRDRTPGLLRWSTSAQDGVVTSSGYVLVDGEGGAAVRQWSLMDLLLVVGDATTGPLLAVEAVQACIDDPSPVAKLACLRGAVPVSAAMCDAGWEREK